MSVKSKQPKKLTGKPVKKSTDSSSSPCDCAKQVDAELAKMGVSLEKSLRMNFETGKGEMAMPFIAVRWSGKPVRGKRLPTLMPSYCPFCGKKMKGE